MTKIALFILVAAVGAGAGVIGYLQTDEPDIVVEGDATEEPEDPADAGADTDIDSEAGVDEDTATEEEPEAAATVTIDEDGGTLLVSGTDGSTLETLTIDQVNQWNEENWDTVFTDRPSFGEMREVNFDGFSRFDTSATVDPDGEAVYFTVNDYAAAATMTFLYQYDLETETFTVLADSLQGGVSELLFSDDGAYVAMVRDSARVAGDGLTVVSTAGMEVMASLDAESILEELPNDGDMQSNQYLPNIREVAWSTDGTLSFVTDDTEGAATSWTMNSDGSDLRVQ